jgi:hypothetical protein
MHMGERVGHDGRGIIISIPDEKGPAARPPGVALFSTLFYVAASGGKSPRSSIVRKK